MAATTERDLERAAETKLLELLHREDWKKAIIALPEPEFTRVVRAKLMVFLRHGHELSDRQSKAGWLDTMGSMISQRAMYQS